MNELKSKELFQKGVSLREQGKYNEAFACFKQQMRLLPETLDSLYNIGLTYYQSNQFEMAVACFCTVLAIFPESPTVYTNLGSAYRYCKQLDKAVNCFTKALELSPHDPDIYSNLSIVYSEQGKFDKAIECCKKTIELKPNYVMAYKSLADLKTFEPDDPLFIRLETLMRDNTLSLGNKSLLFFTLGKMYDDIGDYKNAWDNFVKANTCRSEIKGRDFDFESYKARVTDTINEIDDVSFEERKGWGIETNKPVFVLGMPRSGTSLVEQILASHSKIYGAGELAYIGALLANLEKSLGVGDGQSGCKAVSEKDVAQCAGRYLDRIERVSSGADRVVDKTPLNFERLWFIALLFPGARVIHCRRNPVDTCLSCYFQNFTFGHGYKNNLKDLGRFYLQYKRMMQQWKRILPVQILDVEYEKVVENMEQETKRLLTFCGLDFEPGCLDFHKTKRNVVTASKLQVKKKLYTSSMNRWKNYRPYIGTLLDILGGEHDV